MRSFTTFGPISAALLALWLAGAAAAAPPPTLDGVLSQIDRAAANIHSLTAQVVSLKYTKLVNDTTVEAGDFYYRKTARGMEIALEIRKPYRRDFIYRDDTGWIYQPRIKQAQEFDLSRNREAVAQFLLLGLGGGGHALLASYQVALEPEERGLVHLHLTPKRPAPGVSSIDLWYDPKLWVTAAQQVNQPSGDYQRLNYSDIHLNARIADRHFSTDFPGATIVRPQAP